jgi:hypothetical protein
MLASSRSRARRVLRRPKLRTSRPRSSLSTPICGQRRSEPSSSIRRSGRLRCGHASTALRVDRPRPPSVVDTGWVPDLVRATRSASDALTLVVEDVIRPFDGEGRMREMHLHDLPWPAEVLAELGEAPVTLSYFVEPNPGRRGWTRRYSYASHGLMFDVRRATESTEDFRKRINQLALSEEERRPSTQSDAAEWYFGPDQRVAGSLHSDMQSGAARASTLTLVGCSSVSAVCSTR